MTERRRVATPAGAIMLHLDGDPAHPAITFVHSLATDAGMWAAEARRLARTHHVIRIDLPGHGGSPIAPPGHGIDDLARDILAAWNALGVDRSTYVGLSLGGSIGLALTIAAPDRVSGAVLSSCRFDSPPAYRQRWQGMRAQLRAGGMAAVADATLPGWLSVERRTADPALAAALRSGIATMPAAAWDRTVDALCRLDHRPLLSQLATPTVFVCGAADGLHDEMRACAIMAGGSPFVGIADGAHLLNLDRPQPFAAIIDRALAADPNVAGFTDLTDG